MGIITATPSWYDNADQSAMQHFLQAHRDFETKGPVCEVNTVVGVGFVHMVCHCGATLIIQGTPPTP